MISNRYNVLRGKKAAYFTLGCKLNFSETSTIASDLEVYGVSRCLNGKGADICIINTCTVTSVADKKARSLIHKVVKDNPGAAIVVTGCYAQLYGELILKIAGVSMVVGAGRKSEIVSHLCNYFLSDRDNDPSTSEIKNLFISDKKRMHIFEEGCSKDDRTRHFLKVQDGCNYTCSYCTIPKARGFSRNGSIKSLVEKAQKVAEEGGKEIVLTGVNIGDFGRTTKEKLSDLIKALDVVEGIERYRISSLEPDLISDELIEIIATSQKFMPHWHIPLQCGSDNVLKLMRRNYRTKLFAERLSYIKTLMPDSFIGLDIIVGMRGETESFFQESLTFLKQQPFTRLHVFPYSERSGTDALKITPIIPPATKKIRSKIMQDLSMEHLSHFFAQNRGQRRFVLWEKTEKKGHMSGYTDNYIKVIAPYDDMLAGNISEAIIERQVPGEEYCFSKLA